MRREWIFLHFFEGFLAPIKGFREVSIVQNVDSSGWATVLEVLWLHASGKDMKYEWELLERKTVA